MMNDIWSILYRNSAGELQIRLDDERAKDVPKWPGQWAPEDVHVVIPSALIDELIELAQMSIGRVKWMLRTGHYTVIRPAEGLGMHLDREQILMCNPDVEMFFTLNITKGWREGDGLPQIGVVGVRPWRADRENRELVALRNELAGKLMPPEQYARWAQAVRSTIPQTALEWVMHKRDKVLVEGVDQQGRKLFIGILPYAFTTQPCLQFVQTDEFWAWLDGRIRESREYESRINGQPVEDFCLEDLTSLRLRTKREPVQYDFILWSRP